MHIPSTATGGGQPDSAGFLQGREPIRGELLGPDQLRQRAAEVARAAALVDYRPGRQLSAQLQRNASTLDNAHRQIAAAAANHESITGAAEWLLDNFHIVSETLREIRTDLPPGYYRRLPKLTSEPLAGLPLPLVTEPVVDGQPLLAGGRFERLDPRPRQGRVAELLEDAD